MKAPTKKTIKPILFTLIFIVDFLIIYFQKPLINIMGVQTIIVLNFVLVAQVVAGIVMIGLWYSNLPEQ